MKAILLFMTCVTLVHAQGNVNITGRIADYGNGEVQVYVYNNCLEVKPLMLAKTSTDSHGRFSTRISLSKPQPVFVSYGDSQLPMSVWMEPGDTLSMDIQKQFVVAHSSERWDVDKGKAVFGGTQAAINNYLFDAGLIVPDPKIPLTANRKSLQDYKIFLDSIQSARLVLKANMLTGRISKEAEEYLYGEVVSSTIGNKHMSVAYKRNKNHQDSLQLASADFFNFWKDWKPLSDQGIMSAEYWRSLQYYYEHKAWLQMGTAVNDEMREDFFALCYNAADRDLVDRPISRERLTAFFVYHMLAFVTRKDSAIVLVSRFHRSFPNSALYPPIEKRLRSTLPRPAPDIIARDTANRLVKLTDMRGNIIYIDVWASWCGPCLQELPNSLKLAEKFKDKAVRFVYLNIDDSEKSWRGAIARNHITGLNLRADEATSKKIRAAYSISAIPRYILIDEKGLVINSHAKRPSEVEQDIARLLTIGRK